ncbi:MAG: hypothetical protein HRT89_08885, partial [Lentisphaeria bacterium]|nr:hypothetical protein [Lentisphaeria bacterium]
SDHDLFKTALTNSQGSSLHGSPILATETVALIEDKFSEIHLKVNVSEKRLVVISDRWAVSWTASIDGNEVPIIPLYGKSLMGVIVDKQQGSLILSYKSKSLYYGMLASIPGFIILLLFIYLAVKAEKNEEVKVNTADPNYSNDSINNLDNER